MRSRRTARALDVPPLAAPRISAPVQIFHLPSVRERACLVPAALAVRAVPGMLEDMGGSVSAAARSFSSAYIASACPSPHAQRLSRPRLRAP
ncbi:hypothetical protein HYPSUDRAFT_47822 [Hypholoma sublateritium FD-334 SS-4]|uniref:Uncharacterized protein n=1 Tax=Hypholoma sublateritium (strain FD-334 SS-4) TaxID=945553 RepID=A0A0D2LYM9_HYPSF|nr:hypothetical protein HYPSUDRAFT_47822 [Hypholoma sublateritium FD-334 SS-4]